MRYNKIRGPAAGRFRAPGVGRLDSAVGAERMVRMKSGRVKQTW